MKTGTGNVLLREVKHTHLWVTIIHEKRRISATECGEIFVVRPNLWLSLKRRVFSLKYICLFFHIFCFFQENYSLSGSRVDRGICGQGHF